MSATALPWLPIFGALLIIVSGRWLKPAAVLLVAGIVAAFATGQLSWPSLVAMAVLAVAGAAVQERMPATAKVAGALLFLLVAIGLRIHAVPGFHNPLVFDAQVSPGAPRYRMYLNLDELLIVVWIVYAWRGAHWSDSPRQWSRVGVLMGMATAGFCLCVGWLSGLIAWDPKWPSGAWIWLLNHALLVCFGDEAFFRGFVQSSLSRCWQDRRHGEAGALVISAALFGLAHSAAGPLYATLAGVAGLGYGLAYRWGGLQAALLAHATFNLAHFSMFTYPLLQA